jgi:hypothetical protein
MKNRSLHDVHEEVIKKYGTQNNTFDDFKVGDRVKVIAPYVDHYFFFEEEGEVIKNTFSYLGISVKFDKVREFEDGYLQISFNFNPKDLYHLNKPEYKTCGCCKGSGKILKEKIV